MIDVHLSRNEIVANPDQNHADELADVEQFRMAHPATHPADAGQRRANCNEDIAEKRLMGLLKITRPQ